MSEEREVTDAELVRYMDGELEPAVVRDLEARIAADPRVAERVERLRFRAARLTGLLGALDPAEERTAGSERQIRSRLTARRSWTVSPALLRAAAAVVLLVGVTVAVPPARAWVLERVREVAAVLGLERQPAATPEVGITAPDDGSFAFGFATDGPAFDVEAPPAGELVIRRGDGPEGWVEIRGAPGVSPLVLPNGLRLEGAAPAGAVYEVTLPRGVTTVRVRGGSASIVEHRAPAAGESLTIRLDRP